MSDSKESKGIELQPRDKALLKGLLDSRLITIKQAALLHFSGSFEAAKKRLQKLCAAGVIAQRARRPNDPAIYHLGRAGYLHLKEKGMIDPSIDPGWTKIQKRQQISELFLRHELAVMDVKAAFVSAIEKRPDLQLIEMSTAPDRHGFRVVEAIKDSKDRIRFKSGIARPDGFLHVRENAGEKPAMDHYFFLEVDRGTETLNRLVRKARQYSQYYRKGGFAVQLGHKREEYKRFPFRVLMIFMSGERRDNAAEKMREVKAPIKSMVWLTTMGELLADSLGAICVRPMDFNPVVSELDAIKKSLLVKT